MQSITRFFPPPPLSATAAAAASASSSQAHSSSYRPGKVQRTSAASKTPHNTARYEHLYDPDSDPNVYTVRESNADWFDTPSIYEIIHFYEKFQHDANVAVENLRKEYPKQVSQATGRYDLLDPAIVADWFDANHKLKPELKKKLDQNKEWIQCNHTQSNFVFALCPEVKLKFRAEVKDLILCRSSMNANFLHYVMRAFLDLNQPDFLRTELILDHQSAIQWLCEEFNWEWTPHDLGDTATSIPPVDWQNQGITMLKRIAGLMSVDKVNPALVINLDQLKVPLVAGDHFSEIGNPDSRSIAMTGEMKRMLQFRAYVASSLEGAFLPLHLILRKKPKLVNLFHMKEAGVHLSYSREFSVETVQQWVEKVLIPYSQTVPRTMNPSTRTLYSDAIILMLDARSEHRSEEFRKFLQQKYPQIQLVYIPPKCTSELKPTQLAVSTPFKQSVVAQFNEKMYQSIRASVRDDDETSLETSLNNIAEFYSIEYCIQSWKRMKFGRDPIQNAWHHCYRRLYDFTDVANQDEVIREVVETNFQIRGFVPAEDETSLEHEAYVGWDLHSRGNPQDLPIDVELMHNAVQQRVEKSMEGTVEARRKAEADEVQAALFREDMMNMFRGKFQF